MLCNRAEMLAFLVENEYFLEVVDFLMGEDDTSGEKAHDSQFR